MGRTIKVTGKGKISVKPDMVRLVITLSNVAPIYEVAITESAERKDQLSGALSHLGFEGDALKTLFFNVNTQYESYQDQDMSWKQRLVGYQYTHRMKLEFPSDSVLLGKALMAVAHCPGQPEFSIQYTVADLEKAKNELLAKAVADSKEKAVVLCQAAGVQLKNIMSIDYSWGEIDFVTKPVNEMMLCDYNAKAMRSVESIDLDIDPDEIEVTDTVTIVWEIG